MRRDTQAAIIVVQHMGKEFIPSFAERLHWECALDITVARDGEAVTSGRVLIAPGGFNTAIERDMEGKGIVIIREAGGGFYPSIDHTMEAAAHAYAERTLGVLLTGVGSDGAKGLKAIKDAGGATIAEDESTCIVYGMPKAAIEMGVVDEVVPLHGIAEAIMRRI